jgi:predicted regulator of Ras-like GTPase activity (Roadblock/LC7/MglB family)
LISRAGIANKLESRREVCYKPRYSFFYIFVETILLPPCKEMGMSNSPLVMYDEEFQEINEVIGRLLKEANAKVIFLVDKNGQLISGVGETERFDTTSLASLTAGNIAATGGLAKLIGEKEFSILFHEGEKDNLHISIVGGRVILVVLFDNRSSLGLVRLRVKKSSDELSTIFEKLMKKSEEREKRGSADFPFAEITDDDIDNLFS